MDGRKLWVTHGDLFDGVITHMKWLAHFGDFLYRSLLKLNNFFSWIRTKLGLSYWSVSQYLKHKVKNAVSFISDYENALINEARRKGYDGVVCGHIHKAEIRVIDGLLYCNDGDWVESLSALVETHTGELQLIHWPYKDSSLSRTLPPPFKVYKEENDYSQEINASKKNSKVKENKVTEEIGI